MNPKPMSPMKIFVKELRKKNWISDDILKKIMSNILEKQGDLVDLKNLLLGGNLLTKAQVDVLEEATQKSLKSTALVSTAADHEDFMADLTGRVAEEIQQAKDDEWQKMQEQKRKASQVGEASPLKIIIKEIRKQGWCNDQYLKPLISEILDKNGTPRDFLQAMADKKLISPHQMRYLYEHAHKSVQQQKKATQSFVKDELSDLEKSLGGEVSLQTKGGTPSYYVAPTKTMSEPPSQRFKPHSDKVRILSDDEGGFGLMDQGGPSDDDDEKNKLF